MEIIDEFTQANPQQNPQRLGDQNAQIKQRAARFTDAHWAQALVLAKGLKNALPEIIANKHWVERAQLVGIAKAAVSAESTADYANAFNPVALAFLGRMFSVSIVEQIKASLFGMPMHTKFYINSGGFVAGGVAEGAGIPVLKGSTDTHTLTPLKDAGIAVVTDEVATSASPVAMAGVMGELAKAVAESRDRRFLSPSLSGSVTYGQSNFSASGSTVAAILVDFARLFNSLPAISKKGAVLVMSAETAIYLSAIYTTNGSAAFPNMSPFGGSMFNVPVLVSPACADEASPPTRIVALLSPAEIFYSLDELVELDTSNQAALQQDSAPSMPAQITSLYQTNSTALRAILSTSWYARSGAAVYFTTGY
jgi:hypothetical protein